MVFPQRRSIQGSLNSFGLPLLVVLLALLFVVAYGNGPDGRSTPPLFSGEAGAPFSFFPNESPAGSAVRFSLQQPGSRVDFLDDGLTLTWLETAETGAAAIEQLDVQFLGAAPAQLRGGKTLPGVLNMLQGNDSAKWRTNIPTYGQVIYEGLYPGVDLEFSGRDRALMATFELENSLALQDIALNFDGASAVFVSETGGLSIRADGQSSLLQLAKPEAWTLLNGDKLPLDVEYLPAVDGTVRLGSAAVPGAGPVTVVLPLLLPGESGQDLAGGITFDGDGNVYISGATNSFDLPVVDPLQPYSAVWDVFVSKFSADGSTLLYSTYLGGTDSDWFPNVAVDDNGAIYLTGYTTSVDFPLVNPYQAALNGNGDAFISVIAPDGASLTYSSYLGGSNGDSGLEIVPVGDDVLVMGRTFSSDFPTQNPLQPLYGGSGDLFFTRLHPATNSLVFSSFLGGNNDDSPQAMAVDASGKFVITGQTLSDDYPLANPLQAARAGNWDIFVSSVDAAGGSLLFSSYLGGSDSDAGTGVGLDGSGNVHLVGGSLSNDFPLINPFPVPNPGGEDIVVATISPDGGSLLFSALFGGESEDRAVDLAVDGAGSKYLVGLTASDSFPLQSPVQTTHSRSWDLFVTKLDAANEVVFSTYLGGNKSDIGVGVAVDGDQNFVTIGNTLSTNFPTANAYQPGYRGGAGDVAVSKFNGADYMMEFSTFFGGGPYPANPTAVSLVDFGGLFTNTSPLAYLAVGILFLLLLAGLFRRLKNRTDSSRNRP